MHRTGIGVKDGKRYEGRPAIIRAVNTTDAMSGTIEEIPYALLHKITDRITHEVDGINRVLLDMAPNSVVRVVPFGRKKSTEKTCRLFIL